MNRYMEPPMNLYYQAADVSRLAYLGANAFKEAGFEDICVIDDPEGGTEAYVVEDSHYTYLVFTGTNEFDDLKTDLRFLKKEAFSGSQLHRGFWEAWRDVSDVVATEVMERRLAMVNGHRESKPFVYCGHSLGGALAQLAAATHRPDHCITFGAPPVGGKVFKKECEALPDTEFARFVLDGDPVPRLLKWNPTYRQVGTLFFFDRDMELHINPSTWQMLKLRFPRFYDMDDHAIKWYRGAVHACGDEL